MNNPLVSIIIPAYKSEAYIGRCLNSLLIQTYQNWEAIIVIDMCKNDGTSTITNQYAYEDNRIRVYKRTEKTNPANARNFGLNFARGKYIAFLDSDDWWQPSKLTRQIKYMESNPNIVWSCHWLALNYPNGDTFINKAYPGKSMGIEGLHTIIMQKKLLEKIGKFNASMNKADDADLVLRIRNFTSCQIQECLSDCGINPSGLTMNTGKFENLISVTRLAIKNNALWLLPYHWKNYILSSAGFHFD